MPRNNVKQVAGSIAIGILITGIPLVLDVLFPNTNWWKSSATICDWPMALVHNCNFGRNELNRFIIFFFVNIATWSFIAYLVLRALMKSIAR